MGSSSVCSYRLHPGMLHRVLCRMVYRAGRVLQQVRPPPFLPSTFSFFTRLSSCVRSSRYAYISVSLYGGSYFSSAKQTWQLFKRRGVDAIVNDSIVGTALGFGALLVAVGSGAVGL